ncbi:hypothetical protein CGRA01v4_01842 [Colletotrichum graminicola]|nr:hypothetical protein CGRA01v4_01842 [Colletotrichum graminicola]
MDWRRASVENGYPVGDLAERQSWRGDPPLTIQSEAIGLDQRPEMRSNRKVAVAGWRAVCTAGSTMLQAQVGLRCDEAKGRSKVGHGWPGTRLPTIVAVKRQPARVDLNLDWSGRGATPEHCGARRLSAIQR